MTRIGTILTGGLGGTPSLLLMMGYSSNTIISTPPSQLILGNWIISEIIFIGWDLPIISNQNWIIPSVSIKGWEQ